MRRLLFLLSALAGCATPPAGGVEERLVAVLPADCDPWWFTVSRDGSTAAYTERRVASAFLTIGDRNYGPYT